MMTEGILFDLDGVLYVGEQAIDGAADVLQWIGQQAIPHLFLTNTTSRPRSAIVGKLAAMGIVIGEGDILTPAVAASRWIREKVSGPLVLNIPQATAAEFSEFDELPESATSGAGAVILGDLGRAWNFDRLNRAFRLLMQEPPPAFIALGMTRYWRSEDGLQLDTGPFVKALEYASGREAVVMGKPSSSFYATAAGMLGLEPADILMIGDDIQGDIAAAQAGGMHAALVRTGKFREADLQQGIRPDAVFDSIADLPAWWQAQQEQGQ